MQRFLETEKAKQKELDVLLLTGDSGKSVDGLARHLDVDHFKCSNHLTGKTLFSAS
jgi:hypothetical protein